MKTFVITSTKTMVRGNMNKSRAQYSIVHNFFVNALDFEREVKESYEQEGVGTWFLLKKFPVVGTSLKKFLYGD